MGFGVNKLELRKIFLRVIVFPLSVLFHQCSIYHQLFVSSAVDSVVKSHTHTHTHARAVTFNQSSVILSLFPKTILKKVKLLFFYLRDPANFLLAWFYSVPTWKIMVEYLKLRLTAVFNILSSSPITKQSNHLIVTIPFCCNTN